MRYGSVCSGVEAATLAWEPLGWEAAFYAEIEAFPSAVLAHHYPAVPNLGDFTKIKGDEYDGRIDVLVGGTPCQSFSVAGKRAGLDDPRGNLAIEYLALARRLRPKWLVFENVPGLLSSRSGEPESVPPNRVGADIGLRVVENCEYDETGDFLSFLAEVEKCGYNAAWRVLDAQYFGVPQRRRRVFLVGYLGDWRPAAAVLFERESMSGYPAPSREAGQETSGTIAERTGISRNNPEGLTVIPITDKATRCKGGGDTRNNDGSGNGLGVGKPGDPSPTLTEGDKHAIAFMAGQGAKAGSIAASEKTYPTLKGTPSGLNQVPSIALGIAGSETGYALRANPSHSGDKGDGGVNTNLAIDMAVRRLTPRECERLQGMPDDYTRIPWRGKAAKDCPDSPRYRAIGNSMAVPVMKWIGERISLIDKL